MRSLPTRVLAWAAIEHGRMGRVWRSLGRPTALEWTEYLRRWGGLQYVGEDTRIQTTTVFGDPELVWIGKNVLFSTCALVGHDASTPMLVRACDETLAGTFGPTIIHDNVFIGYNAVIMPNVTIGPFAIVGAGAVVTKDVATDCIVAGAPAREIGSVSDLVARRAELTRRLPWFELLDEERRTGRDDSASIKRLRARHFFPNGWGDQVSDVGGEPRRRSS